MSELLTHRFAVMSDRQIARKLLSLATFIGKNETGLAKEKSIALLVVAAARVESKKERLRKDIDDVKQLARKIAANAAEVARENQRLRKRDAEMQAGIDRMSNILAGQSELDAKGDAAQNMRLIAENERLKMLLSMWWRNAFDKDFWMPKCAVEQTIKAIADNNKEVKK